MNQQIINQLKKDFNKFKTKVLAILLYGSYINGKEISRSDIDICIVAGNLEKAKELYKETLSLQVKEPKYDIHIFELMPLYLKNEIINNNQIIFAKSPSELSYYFYFFRKLWQDQAINRIEQ